LRLDRLLWENKQGALTEAPGVEEEYNLVYDAGVAGRHVLQIVKPPPRCAVDMEADCGSQLLFSEPQAVPFTHTREQASRSKRYSGSQINHDRRDESANISKFFAHSLTRSPAGNTILHPFLVIER
jgi:hypothetical protein